MATNKDVEAGFGSEAQPPPYHPDMGEQTSTNNQEVPPIYAATVPTDIGLPPTYDSLYGKVKAAKQGSEGNVDFCKKFLVILCGTIGCTIMLAIIMAIPVAMIVMGAIHKDDCPAERMIPIYLIVGGSFGILKNLSSLMQRCKNRKDDDGDEKNTKTNPFDATLNCFLFAWFIAGNVWVYRTHGKWVDDPTADNYCDASTYWFTFWLITATYILMGCICCCVCFGGIIAACFGVLEK